jgi:integrase
MGVPEPPVLGDRGTVETASNRSISWRSRQIQFRHSTGLRWSHYDEQAEPLGALNLAKTKTGVPRRVPVHPTLARVLAEWRLAGWERTFGRMPTPDDFVTPTRNMTERTAQETPKQLHHDLDTLEFRRRRGHDLRRTFITLAQVAGIFSKPSRTARAATS